MTKNRRRKGPYQARWRKCLSTLPPGIWPDGTAQTHEAAKILGVDVRTIEGLRARGKGPVQIPAGTYYGRAVRYPVWELIVWRNRIIGLGRCLGMVDGNPGGE